MSKPLMTLVVLPARWPFLPWPTAASSRRHNSKNYGGDGAYLAAYLTDAKGTYVRTLWVAGGKAKYYKHLSDWNRLSAADAKRLDG